MPGGCVWEVKRQSIFSTRRMVITRCSDLAIAACFGVLVGHRMCLHVGCVCVRGDMFPASDCSFGLQLLIFTLSIQLFELLGPEGLEMISTLLQQRAAIVNSLLAIPPDRTGYPSGETAPWQPGHPSDNTNSTCIEYITQL